MALFRFKLVLVSIAFTGLLLFLYLFFAVQKIDDASRSAEFDVHVAVQWARDLIQNYSGQNVKTNGSSLNDGDEFSLKTDGIQILMAADSTALGGLVATVNSVITHTDPTSLHFYFIIPESVNSHLSEWMRQKPLNLVKYSVKTTSERDFNPILYKGLFLDYFPRLRGNVIYLDSDVIVQGDIKDLSRTVVQDGTFGAFSEECHAGSNRLGINRENRYVGRLNLKHEAIKKIQKEGGYVINPASCTFSTGVFVSSNLEFWKKSNATNLIRELFKLNEEETILGPQGGNDPVEAAMLAIMYKKITRLDPAWHVRNLGMTTGSRYSKAFLEEAKLLHWNGRFKPWTRRGPEQQIWDRYFVKDPRGEFKPVRRN